MEENVSIQTRISALEQHLEEVRNRAKNLLTKNSAESSKQSISLEENLEEAEKGESKENTITSSDELSSEEAEKQPPQFFQPYQFQYPNYYPMYYPQQDMRQQVDYLQYQLAQNSQVYLSNEKRLKDDNFKLKEELTKFKEENALLNEELAKIKQLLAKKNPVQLEEAYKDLKDKYERLEKEEKSTHAEYKKLEEKFSVLEQQCSKLKAQVHKRAHDKTEDSTREDVHKAEIKRYTDKIAGLENKISSDRLTLEAIKKDLSKADDKIAHLEDTIIETRNSYAQINKKLSTENDSLKKQYSVFSRSSEIKDSDELNKLKALLIQKNKEIEGLRLRIESHLTEEQTFHVEKKVSKRKAVSNSSERLANLKKNYIKAEKEEAGKILESEEQEEYDEESREPSLENQLIHLQIEKQKLENEYIKLPEFSRNLASKIRKAEVESELDNLTKTISCVKTKLRSLNLI